MTRDPLLAALLAERYGRPPLAELNRPLPEDAGTGGPDTPAAINSRRRVLQALDTEEETP